MKTDGGTDMAKYVRVEGMEDVPIPPFIANLCQDEQDKKDLDDFIKALLNAEKHCILAKMQNEYAYQSDYGKEKPNWKDLYNKFKNRG